MGKLTCFVVMSIGNQEIDGKTISSSDLKNKYNDLIKEALIKASPNLEIVRADEVSAPGTITTDILTRIMHSDIVVADITYPNPNVYYELGLRHSCRVGTIIIRDKDGPRVPFDIAHLRHIEYENSPSGIKRLAEQFKSYLDHFSINPSRPDNQFQELAKLTEFRFPVYHNPDKVANLQLEVMMSLLGLPEVQDMLLRQARGEKINQEDFMRIILNNPDSAGTLIKALLASGQLSLLGGQKNT